MGNLLQMGRNLLMPQPINPLSLLPLNDLIQGNEWAKVQQYNATSNYVNLRAQGLAAQYGAPFQSNMGALGSGVQTGLGALFGSQQTPQQGGQQGGLFGLLGSLFGGGGGGGGGGVLDLSGLSMGTTFGY
jgi:hypothetical protein